MVFVMWKWTWVELDEDLMDSETNPSLCGSDVNSLDDLQSDESTMEEVPTITQSVIFKCIGAHKERQYQDTLAIVNNEITKGIAVPMRLQPESVNPVDSNSIAFVCQVVPHQWEQIGYVVKEACNNIHEAMNQNKILSVLCLGKIVCLL